MFNVSAAIAELEFCKRRGMVGVLLYGAERTTGDAGEENIDYYYKAETLPFWKACARLGMFVYLHPSGKTTTAVSPEGLYRDEVITDWTTGGTTVRVSAFDKNGSILGCDTYFEQGSPWGYALSVAQVVYNLILHGLFDQVPDLQIVIGHNGELFAYWLWRIDWRLKGSIMQAGCMSVDDSIATSIEKGLDPVDEANKAYQYPQRKRLHSFQHYWKRNFYVTTSGSFDTAGLVHLLSTTTPDRILFSMDSPYEDMVNATDWLRSVFNQTEIPCETLQAIAYKNAEQLLNWPSSPADHAGFVRQI